MSFTDQNISSMSKEDRIDGGVDVPMEIATFGAGCFWCTDACYRQLQGVYTVTTGYAGGHVENPSYYDVISEMTGHAEVVQVSYDPNMIEYMKLLDVFWKVHNPTHYNRQGNDVGTQYRSMIMYHNEY